MFNLVASLKNGVLIKKVFIYCKNNKKNEELLNILWDEGFILGYKKITAENKNLYLKIFLKYNENQSSINSINFISKPGSRIYCSVKQLWKLNFVQGLIVLSTSQGFKTLVECKKLKLGGELLLIVN